MPRVDKSWFKILDLLQAGDRGALLEVSGVINGYLARYRAFEFRDSWEDLTQDVLIALLGAHRKGSIRQEKAFVGFVGVVTRNKLADFLKAAGKPGAPDLEGDPELADAILERADGERRGRQPDVLIDLDRALSTLPEKQRIVIEAVYLKGQTYQEAADSLGMAPGTLKRMQTQGLKAIRQKMGLIARIFRSEDRDDQD